MKKVLFVSMIFVFVFGWGAVPAKAAPPQPFYLAKVCPYPPTGVCGISSADQLGFLEGGTITYFDHAFFGNDAGVYHEASTILVAATDGSTANGHISWVMMANGKFVGSFTILPGTGSLAGFHASGKIDVLSWPTNFSWTGTYFFAP